MAILFALASAVAERGREPEVSGPLRCAGARQRETEQRIDSRQLEFGGIAGGGPPDVHARLENDGRGIGRMGGAEAREVRGGAREIPAIERIETRAQRMAIDRRPHTLADEHRRGEQPHVSGTRR